MRKYRAIKKLDNLLNGEKIDLKFMSSAKEQYLINLNLKGKYL